MFCFISEWYCFSVTSNGSVRFLRWIVVEHNFWKQLFQCCNPEELSLCCSIFVPIVLFVAQEPFCRTRSFTVFPHLQCVLLGPKLKQSTVATQQKPSKSACFPTTRSKKKKLLTKTQAANLRTQKAPPHPPPGSSTKEDEAYDLQQASRSAGSVYNIFTWSDQVCDFVKEIVGSEAGRETGLGFGLGCCFPRKSVEKPTFFCELLLILVAFLGEYGLYGFIFSRILKQIRETVQLVGFLKTTRKRFLQTFWPKGFEAVRCCDQSGSVLWHGFLFCFVVFLCANCLSVKAYYLLALPFSG